MSRTARTTRLPEMRQSTVDQAVGFSGQAEDCRPGRAQCESKAFASTEGWAGKGPRQAKSFRRVFHVECGTARRGRLRRPVTMARETLQTADVPDDLRENGSCGCQIGCRQCSRLIRHSKPRPYRRWVPAIFPKHACDDGYCERAAGVNGAPLIHVITVPWRNPGRQWSLIPLNQSHNAPANDMSRPVQRGTAQACSGGGPAPGRSLLRNVEGPEAQWLSGGRCLPVLTGAYQVAAGPHAVSVSLERETDLCIQASLCSRGCLPAPCLKRKVIALSENAGPVETAIEC